MSGPNGMPVNKIELDAIVEHAAAQRERAAIGRERAAASAALQQERARRMAAEDATRRAAAIVRQNAESSASGGNSPWYGLTFCLPYMKLTCSQQARMFNHI